MGNKKYWIAVVSKDHVLNGIEWGIMQVCNGKCTPLKRIKKNDLVLFYSSKLKMTDKQPYQSFTAIAEAIDDNVYQFEMNPEFIPFRRKVKFIDCKETLIRPLISDLDFIENKTHWGYPFRYGLLEISEKDFTFIASNMQANHE